MKVGMLTGGGDCPGLNAVIRAAVRKLIKNGHEVIGFMEGWRGIIENNTMSLDLVNTNGIISEGGTIIGTSRTNPWANDGERVEAIERTMKQHGVDALMAMGGDDTLGAAHRLQVERGIKTVGVPKTIDNDLSATDYTFGFDTAINVAMEAVDRLRTTAKSHRRVMVVETMGRHAGWISAATGLAAGADVTLVPEEAIDLAEVASTLTRNRERGQVYNMVVVSEGAGFAEADMTTQAEELDEFGHVRLGGIGKLLAKLIEEKTGYECRYVVLGHLQRGGPPTAFDRILGTRLGLKAAELVIEGKFGRMAALKGNEITDVPLSDAVAELKTVDSTYWSQVREIEQA